MSFKITTEGYRHTFKARMNELIISCHPLTEDYQVGEIRIILNEKEAKELSELLIKHKKW